MRPNTTEVFWSRVTKGEADACWLWQGLCWHDGRYGRFTLKNVTSSAHRWAYILTHGPISKMLEVCHRCDVPRCCNPSHLFLGTRADNAADMKAKGRAARLAGEQSATHKLSEGWVRCILALRAAGATYQQIVGEVPGVRKANVSLICTGKSWRHLCR